MKPKSNVKTYQSSHASPSKNWVNKCVAMPQVALAVVPSALRRIQNGILISHGPAETPFLK